MVEKNKISIETAKQLQFLSTKTDFLNSFEKGIVLDRIGAVLRYGKNAVISKKQQEIIDAVFGQFHVGFGDNRQERTLQNVLEEMEGNNSASISIPTSSL